MDWEAFIMGKVLMLIIVFFVYHWMNRYND